MSLSPAELQAHSRRGRRVGIALFSLLVAGFTVVCSVQVLQQVWAPAVLPTDEPCPAALRGLVNAVERARGEAALETGGERASVQRFRRALEPEWSHRAALDQICVGSPNTAQGLKVIDWLRYAEEHAVRYEAQDVAQLRRRTAKLLSQLNLAPVSGHSRPTAAH